MVGIHASYLATLTARLPTGLLRGRILAVLALASVPLHCHVTAGETAVQLFDSYKQAVTYRNDWGWILAQHLP